MSNIPFYIGNFLACFVPGRKRRSHVRGDINIALYHPRVFMFIRRAYNVKTKTIHFVRQNTLNRVACVVDDEYYVKIFRNVTATQLKNYKFLLDFVRPYISVEIPDIVVDRNMPMYACKKIPGRCIRDFDKKRVLASEDKILANVKKIIREIQSVPLNQIPNIERFSVGLQPERTREKPCENSKYVLAHFDLNDTNFLFDDDLNICGLIDWDSLSIANNPNTDWDIFMKYWNRYKNRP